MQKLMLLWRNLYRCTRLINSALIDKNIKTRTRRGRPPEAQFLDVLPVSNYVGNPANHSRRHP